MERQRAEAEAAAREKLREEQEELARKLEEEKQQLLEEKEKEKEAMRLEKEKEKEAMRLEMEAEKCVLFASVAQSLVCVCVCVCVCAYVRAFVETIPLRPLCPVAHVSSTLGVLVVGSWLPSEVCLCVRTAH